MSSLFEDDSDSDSGRVEAQRRAIKSIRDAAADEPAATVRTHEDGETEAHFTEEGELARLRQSARYREYASTRKRERSSSPETKKRPRTAVLRQSGKRDDVVQVAKTNKGIENHNVKPDSKDIVVLGGKSRDVVSKDTETRRGSMPSSKKDRQGPFVDPKILDDSSDEDSDSSQEGPIGPSLPAANSFIDQVSSILNELPIVNEATLGESHGSYVSAITVDRAGNRIVSGSIDSSLKLWDFNSMTRSMHSFRSVNPLGDVPICNLEFLSSGGLLLCSGESSTAVVLDRDGDLLCQTAKGDMYLVDMARTKGHTGPVLTSKWRPGPNGGKTFATGSADSTVRLWDASRSSKVPMVDNPVIPQVRVHKLRTTRGGKTHATSIDWEGDGKCLVLACADGTVKIIDPSSYSTRLISVCSFASGGNMAATSVRCAPPSCYAPLIVVRNENDSLQVFDRRKMEQILFNVEDLPNVMAETDTCFIEENGSYLMTGTSAKRGQSGSRGSLRLFDTRTFKQIWQSDTDVQAGSAVSMVWHKEINQVLYGCGDGKLRVLFHPDKSEKGVLQCLSRSDYKKKEGMASVGPGEAYLPSEVFGRKSQISNNSIGTSVKKARNGADAFKPEQKSGLNTILHNKATLATHLFSRNVSKEWGKDPREALLQYADIAAKDQKFTSAYNKTQPEVMFAEKTAEQEEEESRKAIYERSLLRKAQKKTLEDIDKK